MYRSNSNYLGVFRNIFFFKDNYFTQDVFISYKIFLKSKKLF